MDFTIHQIAAELKRFRKADRVRLRLLALYKLASGEKAQRIALELGVVPETVGRWKEKFVSGGGAALADRPRPGRPRTVWLRGKLAEKVISFRKTLGWGAETIAAHLKAEDGIEVPRHRIEALLKAQGLIKQKRKKEKKRLHTRKVKVLVPGAHTQLDVCYVFENRRAEPRYLYNFVDHASRWSFKRIYNSRSVTETREFMRELLERCPFSISRLQTDNGTEFTNRLNGGGEHFLDRFCKENGIRLVHIPPGEKELQGLVERHHRIDREQFFDQLPLVDLATANRYLDNYLRFRNGRRRFKAIGWRTPEEYLHDFVVRHLALILLSQKMQAADPELAA